MGFRGLGALGVGYRGPQGSNFLGYKGLGFRVCVCCVCVCVCVCVWRLGWGFKFKKIHRGEIGYVLRPQPMP